MRQRSSALVDSFATSPLPQASLVHSDRRVRLVKRRLADTGCSEGVVDTSFRTPLGTLQLSRSVAEIMGLLTKPGFQLDWAGDSHERDGVALVADRLIGGAVITPCIGRLSTISYQDLPHRAMFTIGRLSDREARRGGDAGLMHSDLPRRGLNSSGV